MKTRLLSFLTVLIVTFLCSCTKNSNSTIILMGEEKEVVEFSTIATDVLQKALFKYGYVTDTTQKLKLTTPPNVEGKYRVDTIFYLAIEEYINNGSIYLGDPAIIASFNSNVTSIDLEFNNQNNRTVDLVFLKQAKSGNPLYVKTIANVVGASYIDSLNRDVDIFALYYVYTMTSNDTISANEYSVKSGMLITGQILSDGIKDIKFSEISMDKWGNGASTAQRIGDFRVYEDKCNKYINYITPRIN